MASVIFDFDSTLIGCESLEEILAEKLNGRAEVLARLKEITEAGMAGQIPFRASLDQRLQLAAPHREEVHAFGERAWPMLTLGMDRLVAKLHQMGHTVWIISGGLREAILPIAQKLGIPHERVFAVCLKWDAHGQYAGLDPNDGFSENKVVGLGHIKPQWDRPCVMIGDGMTDYAVYRAGYAQHFIAFTQHRRRPPVVEAASLEAANVSQLERELERLI